MLKVLERPKTREVQLSIALYEQQAGIFLPPEFIGKRFKLQWGKATVTLTEDQDGLVVGKSNGHGRVQFYKNAFPFQLFRANRVTVDAVYDGKSIIFDTPEFTRKDGPKKQWTKRQKYDDLRKAIENVNELARRYNAALDLEDGVLTGVIQL